VAGGGTPILSSAIPPSTGITQPPTSSTILPGRRQSNLPEGFSLTAPPISSTMVQYFLPSTLSVEQAASAWRQQTGQPVVPSNVSVMLYEPLLLAQAEVHYADRKSGISLIQDYCYHVPDVARAGLIRWDEYQTAYTDPRQISETPFGEAAYGDLPAGLADSKRITALKTELTDYIYKTAALVLMYNPDLDLYSTPDMSRRDFMVQAQGLARERRDDEIDKTAARYDKVFDALEAKLRKAARGKESDQRQADALRGEELATMGEAALSLLRGRTTYTVSRVSRSRRYKEQARDNVYEAEQQIAELDAQLGDAQAAMENELQAVNDKWAQIAAQVQDYRLNPLKKDIYLGVFGIGWKPYWMVLASNQPVLIPAWGEQ
jgi:hypothetical protein